jgi:hypothetical protein
MIRKKHASGFDPTGGYRFSEKHALGLDPMGSSSSKDLERDDDLT